jgi:hypothetical protein
VAAKKKLGQNRGNKVIVLNVEKVTFVEFKGSRVYPDAYSLNEEGSLVG